MANQFDPATHKALRTSGWTVGAATARRDEGPVHVQVWANGHWTVRQGSSIAGRGTESCAAYAAMDANECAWALRRRLA